MTIYELKPTAGQKQRSFYGKAAVIIADGGSETLLSYDKPIIKKDSSGAYIRLYDGYTATTGRHIRAFCGMNKAEFMRLPLICQ